MVATMEPLLSVLLSGATDQLPVIDGALPTAAQVCCAAAEETIAQLPKSRNNAATERLDTLPHHPVLRRLK